MDGRMVGFRWADVSGLSAWVVQGGARPTIRAPHWHAIITWRPAVRTPLQAEMKGLCNYAAKFSRQGCGLTGLHNATRIH